MFRISGSSEVTDRNIRMHVFLCSSSFNQRLNIDCLAPLHIDNVCLRKHKFPTTGICSVAALSRKAVENTFTKLVFL